MKGLLLISGGLDSLLAGKILLEQGVEIEAINFHTPFCTCIGRDRECKLNLKLIKRVKEFLGIPLLIFNLGQEYLEMVKKPKYGYGSNMNPCIDCKILFFKKAKEYMQKKGFNYLVTGEVLGERPMSQNFRTLYLIEREAGLEGLVLRPLSAKHLPLSIPEKQGWVDRKRLLGIRGRSRKPQLELIKNYGLEDHPTPAGGCLLTDPGFSKRLADLMKYKPNFDLRDVDLLKLGRHFRINEKLKLIVGRNEWENKKLEAFFLPERGALLVPLNAKGPNGLLEGSFSSEDLNYAVGILASYCKSKDLKSITIRCKIEDTQMQIEVEPKDKKVFSDLMI
jgi:tRNA U34 2-thiouridine synthase MnmA/TrmU